MDIMSSVRKQDKNAGAVRHKSGKSSCFLSKMQENISSGFGRRKSEAFQQKEPDQGRYVRIRGLGKIGIIETRDGCFGENGANKPFSYTFPLPKVGA